MPKASADAGWGESFGWCGAFPGPAEVADGTFDEWSRAVDSGDPEPIDQAYEAIRAAVTMTYPNGRQVPEFMLGIEGDHAGFRWHDEPFGDH